MHIAAETFAIRFLCSFGEPHLREGVMNLDDVYAFFDVFSSLIDRPEVVWPTTSRW